MKARWVLRLLPPMLASLSLLAVSQLVFIEGSFHRDLGIGRLAEGFELSNELIGAANQTAISKGGLIPSNTRVRAEMAKDADLVTYMLLPDHPRDSIQSQHHARPRHDGGAA